MVAAHWWQRVALIPEMNNPNIAKFLEWIITHLSICLCCQQSAVQTNFQQWFGIHGYIVLSELQRKPGGFPAVGPLYGAQIYIFIRVFLWGR